MLFDVKVNVKQGRDLFTYRSDTCLFMAYMLRSCINVSIEGFLPYTYYVGKRSATIIDYIL